MAGLGHCESIYPLLRFWLLALGLLIGGCGSAAAPGATSRSVSDRCERVPRDFAVALEESMDLPTPDPKHPRVAKKREVTLRNTWMVRSRAPFPDAELRREAPDLYFISADLVGREVGGYGGRATWASAGSDALGGPFAILPMRGPAAKYAEEGSFTGIEEEYGIGPRTDGYAESRSCVGPLSQSVP
jgi:hypothetical protein